MNDFPLFLGKFLRHGTAIASLAPSSRWLARATARNIDWSRPQTVVELGAGTGPITRELAMRARGRGRLLVIERDLDFLRLLRERFGDVPNLEVIDGDVQDLAAMLAERGVEQVDQIVSGLPVPSFSKESQAALIRDIRALLNPGGTFNQITEMPWVYQRFYRRYFDDVKFVFEPRNFPPAGVYYCRGPKAPPETS